MREDGTESGYEKKEEKKKEKRKQRETAEPICARARENEKMTSASSLCFLFVEVELMAYHGKLGRIPTLGALLKNLAVSTERVKAIYVRSIASSLGYSMTDVEEKEELKILDPNGSGGICLK